LFLSFPSDLTALNKSRPPFPLSSRAQPRDPRFHLICNEGKFHERFTILPSISQSQKCAVALRFVIPTGAFMGRRPTQGDEKRLSCSNYSPWARYPPPCHPERSRGTCGSADLSWKCFSTERSGGICSSTYATSECAISESPPGCVSPSRRTADPSAALPRIPVQLGGVDERRAVANLGSSVGGWKDRSTFVELAFVADQVEPQVPSATLGMTKGRAVTFIKSRQIGWTEKKQQSLHSSRAMRKAGFALGTPGSSLTPKN